VGLDTKAPIWAARVLENDYAPDLLINNAAVMNRLAPLREQDDRELTWLVDANIRSVQTFSTG
jgi:NADP-dependent 3-hydroxy acid dehydrogenase YdfG